jgi:hypothetical protein
VAVLLLLPMTLMMMTALTRGFGLLFHRELFESVPGNHTHARLRLEAAPQMIT